MDISETLVEFTGEVVEKYYNQFFNPNICHICKNPNEDNLIPCIRCGLIFYCSEEHKKMHENSHRQICVCIKHEIEGNAKRKSHNFAKENWPLSRRLFLYKIQAQITNILEPYEIEMFLCTKSCFICHQRTDLKTCKKCYSVNYCKDHETNFKEEHILKCKNLLVLLNLNILAINGVIDVTYPSYVMLDRVTSNIDDMFMFVDKYIKEYSQHHELQPHGVKIWKWQCYIYSDYASAPLTLYYTLMKIENSSCPILQNDFTVHIIAANFVDIRGLPSWELFMHCFPQIKKLNIILIIPKQYCRIIKFYNLCSICNDAEREMTVFGMSHVSYNDYVTKEMYNEANVIIVYEAKFYIEEELFKIFTSTLDRTCPFIFTSRSRRKAQQNINKIKKYLCSKNINLIENKFQSCRPYRDYTSGEIFYRNAYIAAL